MPGDRFVVCIQNHDQVGNRAHGDRLATLVEPPALRLAASLLLLAPHVPLLFMGEEYGEVTPFQFFSNHIDQEIAVATREGRQREFASFASFEHQVPDPEDPATFERSKLTRRSDTEIARLYARLIEARNRLAPDDATAIACDESERWLRFRRGAHEVVCNFGTGWLRLECEGGEIELATDDWAILSEGYLKLPPMSGALIR